MSPPTFKKIIDDIKPNQDKHEKHDKYDKHHDKHGHHDDKKGKHHDNDKEHHKKDVALGALAGAAIAGIGGFAAKEFQDKRGNKNKPGNNNNNVVVYENQHVGYDNNGKPNGYYEGSEFVYAGNQISGYGHPPTGGYGSGTQIINRNPCTGYEAQPTRYEIQPTRYEIQPTRYDIQPTMTTRYEIPTTLATTGTFGNQLGLVKEHHQHFEHHEHYEHHEHHEHHEHREERRQIGHGGRF